MDNEINSKTYSEIDFRELFPRTKFRLCLNRQLDAIIEEVEETREAVFQSDERLLLEAIDILHSTFSLLYNEGYSNQQIFDAIRQVQDKNRKRGYYVE